MTVAPVVGREDLVEAAARALIEAHGVVLVGEAGVGKSTVLGLVRSQVARDWPRILMSYPAEPDAVLPFVTLIDLLSSVGDRFFDELSAAGRGALDAALLKHERPTRDMDRLAVRLGTLELLRRLAEDAPTLLVVDDAQWMDPASAEVLAFALRRMPDATIGVLAAERLGPGPASPVRTWLPASTVELVIRPLAEGQLVQVVTDQAGEYISPGVARHIAQLAAGNPFLALEIVDALRRRGIRPAVGEPLPVPSRLDALMRQRLANVPDSARDTLHVAAAAARPTLSMLLRSGCADAVDDLVAASGAGIAELGVDGSVTFEHPLVRAAVYAQLTASAQMEVHARLADAVVDPIDRARHLALATAVNDDGVAGALTDAATLARRRGAVDVAFELAGLAAARTPERDLSGWAERKLAQGWHAYAAGLTEEAQRVAREVLAADVSHHQKARAWVIILEAMGQRIGQAETEIRAALAEAAGDPSTEAWVLVHAAWYHTANGRSQLALTTALQAADLAAAHGLADAEIRALEAADGAQRRLGEDSAAIRARALALVERVDVGGLAWTVYYLEGVSLYSGDQFLAAREMLSRAVDVAAEDPGYALESRDVLRYLRKVELRLGNCAAALALTAQINLLSDKDNLALGGLAEVELAAGSLARAEELAHQAVAAATKVGDHDSMLWYYYLLTACRLLAGDAAGAVGFVRLAEQYRADEGLTSRVRVLYADLVEALARTGSLAEARRVVDQLNEPADPPPTRSVAAARARAEAILLLAEGRPDEAADLLTEVRLTQQRLGMRLDEARTLVAAAEVERRRRRRGAARALLVEAQEACTAMRAMPMLERVVAELERLGPLPRGAGSVVLSPMEERITTMAVEGATNREIATALSIGLSTVESSLSQIYRKLGVRSRIDLVRVRPSPP